ncbi:MAG: hypothetical protein ACPGKR_08020 [Poseidonia sp.]
MEERKATLSIINWMLQTGDAGRFLRLLEEQAARERAEEKENEQHGEEEE